MVTNGILDAEKIAYLRKAVGYIKWAERARLEAGREAEQGGKSDGNLIAVLRRIEEKIDSAQKPTRGPTYAEVAAPLVRPDKVVPTHYLRKIIL